MQEALSALQTTVTDLSVAFGTDASGKARMETYKDRIDKARGRVDLVLAEEAPAR